MRRKTSEVLMPPKAKLFFIAYSMSSVRPSPRMWSMPSHSGSGVSRLMVGANYLPRIISIVHHASIAPQAPSVWPT